MTEDTIQAYHVTPTVSVPSIMEHGLLVSSGERAELLGDSGVYLFKDPMTMEDAVMGWLGESFPEDTELSALTIWVNSKALSSEAGFEWVAHKTIPPELIVATENI